MSPPARLCWERGDIKHIAARQRAGASDLSHDRQRVRAIDVSGRFARRVRQQRPGSRHEEGAMLRAAEGEHRKNRAFFARKLIRELCEGAALPSTCGRPRKPTCCRPIFAQFGDQEVPPVTTLVCAGRTCATRQARSDLCEVVRGVPAREGHAVDLSGRRRRADACARGLRLSGTPIDGEDEPHDARHPRGSIADRLPVAVSDQGDGRQRRRLADAVIAVAQRFDPLLDPTKESRLSKAGNYRCPAVTITATSREQPTSCTGRCRRTRW